MTQINSQDSSISTIDVCKYLSEMTFILKNLLNGLEALEKTYCNNCENSELPELSQPIETEEEMNESFNINIIHNHYYQS